MSMTPPVLSNCTYSIKSTTLKKLNDEKKLLYSNIHIIIFNEI